MNNVWCILLLGMLSIFSTSTAAEARHAAAAPVAPAVEEVASNHKKEDSSVVCRYVVCRYALNQAPVVLLL